MVWIFQEEDIIHEFSVGKKKKKTKDLQASFGIKGSTVLAGLEQL